MPALFPAETVLISLINLNELKITFIIYNFYVIFSSMINLQRLLDGAQDISAVFYVKIQIGGKFLVEQ